MIEQHRQIAPVATTLSPRAGDTLGAPKANPVQPDFAANADWDRELSAHHAASFVAGDTTLLVCFTPAEQHPKHKNVGFAPDLARSRGWSMLNLSTEKDDWYRDPAVFGIFDTLIDIAFFDQFETVLFYGAGMYGYAAATFSVAALGAEVLLVAPQATLDPRRTGWDTRFPDARGLEFANRYGFAPDMVEVAQGCYIVFDPSELMDAVHASLFQGPNVLHLPCPGLGPNMEKPLIDAGVLGPVLDSVAKGKFTAAEFAKLRRLRRKNGTYLRALSRRVDVKRTPLRVAIISLFAQAHAPNAYFTARLKQALERLDDQGKRPAWLRDVKCGD